MKMHTHFAIALALGLSTAMVAPVAAQSESGQRDRSQDNYSQNDRGNRNFERRQTRSDNDSQNQDNWREQRQRQSEERSNQRSSDSQRSSNQSNQSRRNVQLDYEGWVKVATDYNNDGRFDTIETIYLYDLERARKTSQARAAQQQQGRSSDQYASDSRNSRTLQVKGTVKKLQRKQMMDSDQKKVVATLEDQQKRIATVCLGPENKVNQLNLSEGDTIHAHGKRARVDGRPILMARKVSANGQSIENQISQQRKLKRLKGEVVSVRKANFEGRDGEFLVARIHTDQQGTQQVNLGTAQDLSDLNISEGTEIRVLAREGKINNRPAMIAEAVRANEQSVDVRGSTRRTLKPQLPNDQSQANDDEQANDADSQSESNDDQQSSDNQKDDSDKDWFDEFDR